MKSIDLIRYFEEGRELWKEVRNGYRGVETKESRFN